MSFPVYIPIGPWRVHPHLLFESLSYFIGVFGYPLLAGHLIVARGIPALLSATMLIALGNFAIALGRLLPRLRALAGQATN